MLGNGLGAASSVGLRRPIREPGGDGCRRVPPEEQKVKASHEAGNAEGERTHPGGSATSVHEAFSLGKVAFLLSGHGPIRVVDVS